MKNIVSFIFLLALLVSGCSQEEILKDSVASSFEGRVFTTSFEQNDSRTYVENGLHSRWTEGDCISLFDASTLNCRYLFAGDTGDSGGNFFMLSKPEDTGTALSTNYAVYPYSEDVKMTEDGVISVTLPSEQHYAENSYGLGDNTMVAVTKDADDTFLSFKNVGGCLKLQLYGDDVTVKSITLKGNNGEKIAGKATITPTYGEVPTVRMTDDATETITLDCGEKGIKLGTTEETATSFWIVVPPTTFAEGFTVMVTDVYGAEFVQSTSNKIIIERSTVKPMAMIKLETSIPYITFTANSIQTLTMSKVVETLEYSINNSEWKELGINIVEFGGDKGNLRLRGISSIGTALSKTDYSNILFANSEPVSCKGDIRTLINYKDYLNAETKDARFCFLFKYTSLETAPELPATTLASYCYAHMFQGCNNLSVAPKLPATTLANNCYESMFKDCIGLINTSDLPATKLASYCYSTMFSGCKKLVEAPELPATTLASHCYEHMFGGTSLTNAPELPATTLADYCYEFMFQGCTTLTAPPELPATKLADYCYKDMFRACPSLTTAPELPATNLNTGCYENMFWGCSKLNYINVKAMNFKVNGILCIKYWVYGVASQGTFVRKAGSSALTKGPSGIPAGWTIKNL